MAGNKSTLDGCRIAIVSEDQAYLYVGGKTTSLYCRGAIREFVENLLVPINEQNIDRVGQWNSMVQLCSEDTQIIKVWKEDEAGDPKAVHGTESEAEDDGKLIPS